MKRYQLCESVPEEHLYRMSERRHKKAIAFFMANSFYWNSLTSCWERNESYLPLSELQSRSASGNVGLSEALVFPTKEAAEQAMERICPRSGNNENAVA
jgi:hypothetical protein